MHHSKSARANRFPLLARLVLLLAALPLNLATASEPNEHSSCSFVMHANNGNLEPTVSPKLVVIIDDLGHNLQRGKRALELPGNLTYAVIPYTNFGKELAQAAHEAGKEVMLHAPMSTIDNDPLGDGGLTPQLSRKEFHTEVVNALAEVPHAQGINNHMGSDLTQRRQQMAWLMQELRWQDLYFVDSRTSEKSVAAKVAEEFSVPNLARHIFLDNELDEASMRKRFAEAIRAAERHGTAVVIGHPHPETTRYLRKVLPMLGDLGVQLQSVSQALEEKESAASERGYAVLSKLKSIDSQQPDC